MAIAAGESQGLAVRRDGTVWYWGWNSHGEAGDGTRMPHPSPVRVLGLSGVLTVAAGNGVNYAVKADGTLWAWGWNRSGQLGDGTNTDRTTPVQVQGLSGVQAIAAGSAHALALDGTGTLWSWGSDTYGQLGLDTTLIQSDLVPVIPAPGTSAFARLDHSRLNFQAIPTTPLRNPGPAGAPDLYVRLQQCRGPPPPANPGWRYPPRVAPAAPR